MSFFSYAFYKQDMDRHMKFNLKSFCTLIVHPMPFIVVGISYICVLLPIYFVLSIYVAFTSFFFFSAFY